MKNIKLMQHTLNSKMHFSLLGIFYILVSAFRPIVLHNDTLISNISGAVSINPEDKYIQQKPGASKKAEFPGGRKALRNYPDDNFMVPKNAFRLKNKEVVIGAQLVLQINLDGSASLLKISDLRVQPKDPATMQAVKTELIRVVSQMPKWTPALKDGQPIISLDTLAFIKSFALNTTWEDYRNLTDKTRAEREKTNSSADDLRTKNGKKVFTFVQKQASFPGGDKALKAYLIQNLKYLQSGQNTEQLVVLNIIVNENGIAEDLKVVKPEGITLNPQDVAAALKKMPAWTPGKQSGQSLPVSYIFPVRL